GGAESASARDARPQSSKALKTFWGMARIDRASIAQGRAETVEKCSPGSSHNLTISLKVSHRLHSAARYLCRMRRPINWFVFALSLGFLVLGRTLQPPRPAPIAIEPTRFEPRVAAVPAPLRRNGELEFGYVDRER